MKKIKYLFVMFVAVMVSVSCSNDDDDGFDDNFDDNFGDSALVGTWEWSEFDGQYEIKETVTFKENLSGTLVSSETFEGTTTITESESFTWSTDGIALKPRQRPSTKRAGFTPVMWAMWTRTGSCSFVIDSRIW